MSEEIGTLIEERRCRLLLENGLITKDWSDFIGMYPGYYQKLFDSVNSTNFDKLEVVICISSYRYNTESDYRKHVINVLEDERSSGAINSIDMDKIKLVIKIHPFDVGLFEYLIENENALAGLNLIDFERFRMLFAYDKRSNYEKDIKEVLENLDAVKAINSTDIKKLDLIFDNGKFGGTMLWKIFKNPVKVEAINSMDIEKLETLLKNGRLCMELEMETRKSTESEKIKLLIENDKYCENLSTFEDKEELVKVNIDKLKLIVESDLFDWESTMKLITKEARGKLLINSVDITKFAMLLNMRKVYVPVLLRKPESGYLNEKCCYTSEEEDRDSDYRNFVNEVLAEWYYIECLNCLETERFELILNRAKGRESYKYLSYFIKGVTLYRPLAKFNSMDIKKLDMLLNHYSLFWMFYIVKNYMKGKLDLIDFLKIPKLEIIVSWNRAEDLRKISMAYNGDMKKNVDLAIALYVAGALKRVIPKYALNENLIERKIKEMLPSDLPIDKILMPSSTSNQGRVSCLKYLCLEKVIYWYHFKMLTF